MSNIDISALFKIGYGLYVVTSNDGVHDNGCILNSVIQLTNTPNRVGIVINKQNYSHDSIMSSGKMNVNVLTVDTPFSVFKNFGFQSGKTANKFADGKMYHSENGLPVLTENINSFMSLKVESTVDIDTHTIFICTLTEAHVINNDESMTYDHYYKNVKPKPETKKKEGYVCKICGYVYEGEALPDDFICPICKHGADDFEKL